MDYKATLHLPKTDFPMKANLAQAEPKMLAWWDEIGIYKRLRESAADRALWILHDGPPYANGNLHMGNFLGMVLKDMFVKIALLDGKYAKFVPGWDMHGLPIEYETLVHLGVKDFHSIDPLELRRRNLIPSSAMPFKTGLVFTYDCGEFEKNMDLALAAADRKSFEARRARARKNGKLRGLGFSNTIERSAPAGLEGIAREQPAAATREVDHGGPPREEARAERDLDPHRHALLAAAFLAGVERAHEQEAERFGMDRPPHQVVEADVVVRVGHLAVREPALAHDLLGAGPVVVGHAHDTQALVAVPLVQRLQVRQGGHAGAAPGGPEIEQHHLALERGQAAG